MVVSEPDEREVCGARTQSLFRDVNERVRVINEGFGEVLPLGDWVCECANDACTERVGLTQEEYESVRAHGTQFVIGPSSVHVYPELEDVVERNDRYWVVRKRGRAGVFAARVDPRRVGLRGQPTGGATGDRETRGP